ncbi:hypothetical protein HJG60_007965 [Phyllostomus discolor]|uniref:Uncharacterized protein n=1 Tax=Phyllostomus discolor TaxID=89673 RepID=A0A834BHX6_9CHIR|nr:hypothetical protein HJG60_007965 [Phyllostomus discolor]
MLGQPLSLCPSLVFLNQSFPDPPTMSYICQFPIIFTFSWLPSLVRTRVTQVTQGQPTPYLLRGTVQTLGYITVLYIPYTLSSSTAIILSFVVQSTPNALSSLPLHPNTQPRALGTLGMPH